MSSPRKDDPTSGKQFSAFFGRLNRNRRQELSLRVQSEIGNRSARVRVIPVCEDDLKDIENGGQLILFPVDILRKGLGRPKPSKALTAQDLPDCRTP
jgi:hypothetical protein